MRALAALALLALGFLLLLGVEAVVAVAGLNLADRAPLRFEGSFPGPHGRSAPLTLVWLGDSTGAGVGASAARTALPTLVARGLERPVELRVLAASGATVADVLVDQLPRLPPTRPDVVAVGVGGNDVTHLTPRGFFRDLYDALLASLAAARPGVVVVIGIGDFGSVPRLPQPLRAVTAWRGRRLDDDVRAAAARRGAAYVDLYGRTAPVFAEDPGGLYAADGFHPSDEGYRVWAAAILETLRPLVTPVVARG